MAHSLDQLYRSDYSSARRFGNRCGLTYESTWITAHHRYNDWELDNAGDGACADCHIFAPFTSWKFHNFHGPDVRLHAYYQNGPGGRYHPTVVLIEPSPNAAHDRIPWQTQDSDAVWTIATILAPPGAALWYLHLFTTRDPA